MSLYSRRSSAVSSFNSLGSAHSSRAVSPSASPASSLRSSAPSHVAPPAPHLPFASVQSSRASSALSSHSVRSQSHAAHYFDGAHRDDVRLFGPQRHDSVEVGIERVPSSNASSLHNTAFTHSHSALPSQLPEDAVLSEDEAHHALHHRQPALERRASDRDSLPSRRHSHHDRAEDEGQHEPLIHAPRPVRPIHTNRGWERSMERIVEAGDHRGGGGTHFPRTSTTRQRQRQHSEPILAPLPPNFSRHLNAHSHPENAHEQSGTDSIPRRQLGSMTEYARLRTSVCKMIEALHSHAHSHLKRKPSLIFSSRQQRDSHAKAGQDLERLRKKYPTYWLTPFPDPGDRQGFSPSTAQIDKLTHAAKELGEALPDGWGRPQPHHSVTSRPRGRSLGELLQRVKSRSRSRGANELGSERARDWEGVDRWGRMSQRTAARYGL